MPPRANASTAIVPAGKACCGATTRKGKPCPNPPVTGSQRCRMHSGGITAGRPLTHGKYSRFVPKVLEETFQQLLENPQILSSRHEMALIDARIDQLGAALSERAPAAAWKEARALFKDAVSGSATSGSSMTHLGEILNEGLADVLAWEELRRLIEQKRKLQNSENRRVKDQESFMTRQEVEALGTSMFQLINKYVPDPNIRRLFFAELRNSFTRRPV